VGIELGWLFAIALAYLACLFLIAWCTDSGLIPMRIVKHPMVYSLSLGVYATSWTYYGSVGLADSSGYAFLTIYLGVTGAFLLGPYLLRPILRLCREYQLTSIADLLAFRYGGRATGLIVTLFMLIGILPYISLQIRAVTESVQVLSSQVPPRTLALLFCVVITVFAILFGARHLTPREKHHGLVVAIAFESAIKLIALILAGIFVVTQVFDSPVAMSEWAAVQPGMVEDLYSPIRTSLWPTLLLLAFCAAFLLPRQYHMTFVENENPEHLNTAYWLFPLYLLLLNLPIIPILFAGRFLELGLEPDFYVLGITLSLGHKWLAMLVFLGGLSAASAMMIVTTLALSYMCMNHLLLPASLKGFQPTDFYQRLLWGKRLVISLIIAAGYGFYVVIELNEGLASLGLISFVAAAQLLPGVVGLLFWARATQTGFILGLIGGATAWFAFLILPLLNTNVTPLSWFPVTTDIWTLSTFCTLTVNGSLLILGSLFSEPSPDETTAAQAGIEQVSYTPEKTHIARSVLHYRYAMQQALGNKVANEELERALQDTFIDPGETRTTELRILHEQLERNLTGLVGPTIAREVLRHKQPSQQPDIHAQSPDTRLLELRLEASREQMQGMTKQLDDLRRYLRDVLRQLPIGVCSIAADGKIYIWNSAMQGLTGISERQAHEKLLDELSEPWGTLLNGFAKSTDEHQFRRRAATEHNTVSVNLHKADIDTSDESIDNSRGQVILMEDRSNLDTLEAELAHSERLASIGRLAAGVAHEIGNPLTGIASIAQNLHYDVSDKDGSEPLIKEQTDDILTQVNRINQIVRSLLTFSHADEVADKSHEAVDMSSCISEAVRLVQLSPDTHSLKFDIDLHNDAIVYGDANQLTQVFVNLLNNAADASPTGGKVSVRSHTDGDAVVISTSDEGRGIDPKTQRQVFEPFFTTKPVGQGTGLGLSLAYSIVANHDGKLTIGDNHKGATMIVSLPLAKHQMQGSSHAV